MELPVSVARTDGNMGRPDKASHRSELCNVTANFNKSVFFPKKHNKKPKRKKWFSSFYENAFCCKSCYFAFKMSFWKKKHFTNLKVFVVYVETPSLFFWKKASSRKFSFELIWARTHTRNCGFQGKKNERTLIMRTPSTKYNKKQDFSSEYPLNL